MITSVCVPCYKCARITDVMFLYVALMHHGVPDAKKNRRPKRTRTNKKTPFAGETVNKNEANFSSQQTCHHFTSFATVFPNIWAHQGCCKKVDMAKEPWKNHDGNGKQKHQSIQTLGLVEAFWLWRWRFRWDKCGVPFHLLSTKWVYRSTRKRY